MATLAGHLSAGKVSMTTTKRSESLAISDSNPQHNAAMPAFATELSGAPKGARKLIIAICVYAGLRILLFAAAFPLFNNVDERVHLMSIQMYAQGHLPGKDLPRMDPGLLVAGIWSNAGGSRPEWHQRPGLATLRTS
jgi:hypothetical protein